MLSFRESASAHDTPSENRNGPTLLSKVACPNDRKLFDAEKRIILLIPAPDGILLRTAAFRESAADLLSGFASSPSEDDPPPGGAKRLVICF